MRFACLGNIMRHAIDMTATALGYAITCMRELLVTPMGFMAGDTGDTKLGRIEGWLFGLVFILGMAALYSSLRLREPVPSD